MQRLKALDARHKAAIRMKLAGKDNDFIAKELNMSKRTLVVWFSDDLVKDAMQEMALKIEEEFAVEMARGGMIALGELVEMVQKPARESDISDHTKIEVAREILDRIPATTRVRERATQNDAGGDNYLQIFANMTDAKLAEFLTGGWAKPEAVQLAEGDATRS